MAEMCEHCGKTFKYSSNLYRHVRDVHKLNFFKRILDKTGKELFKCNYCSKNFICRNSLYRHRSAAHKSNIIPRSKRNNVATNSRLRAKYGLDEISKDDVDQVVNTFPTGFIYRVIRQDKSKPFIEFQFSVSDVQEIRHWKSKYEEKNKLFFRKNRAWKSNKESIIYKEKYHCGHHVPGSKNNRNTNCPFYFLMLVRKKNTSCIASVRLFGSHNHNIGGPDSVKFRPVSIEVKEKLLALFHRGYTPGKALRSHVKDLQYEYGDQFFQMQNDRFYNPDLKWVQRLYVSVFKKEYGARYTERMFENLKKVVTSDKYTKLQVIDENSNYVVAITTPFMLRVHERISLSSEIVFVDSTDTLDRLGCKVFILLTNSSSGGLPLGALMTTQDSKEALVVGLKMLQELVADVSFGRRGSEGPQLFVTDNSHAVRGALHEVFPDSKLLLCQFHILQAMWQYLWDNDSDVYSSHRKTLFHLFKSLVYETNKYAFENKVEESYQHKIAQLYPAFLKHLKDIVQSKKDWAMCYRLDLTRSQNTNNNSEASMRIIKELILNQYEAYSPAQLLTFLTGKFQEFYIDNLLFICNGLTPRYFDFKSEKTHQECDGLIYDADTAEVHDIKNNQLYDVDSAIGLCSCIDGIGGMLCKHLLLALKDNEMELRAMIPASKIDRKNLLFIATGEQLEDDQWFKPVTIFDNSSEPSYDQNNASSSTETAENEIIVPEVVSEEIYEYMIDCGSDEEEIIEEIDMERFDAMVNDLRIKVQKNPNLKHALNTMVNAYENIQTLSALESAMLLFGK